MDVNGFVPASDSGALTDLVDDPTDQVHPPEDRGLALVSYATRLLAESRTVEEVKDIRDKAQALRHYLKKQGESLEEMNAAAELKIRAERRAGELLSEMDFRTPGPLSQRDRSHDATDLPPRLDDLGLTKSDSSRWQQIAGLSEEVFEAYIAGVKSAGQELSTAGVLRLAVRAEADEMGPRTWTLDELVDRLDDSVKAICARCSHEQLRQVLGHKLVSMGNEILTHGELRP